MLIASTCTRKRHTITTWARNPGGAPEIGCGDVFYRRWFHSEVVSDTILLPEHSTNVEENFETPLQRSKAFTETMLIGTKELPTDVVTIISSGAGTAQVLTLYSGFILELDAKSTLIIQFPNVSDWLMDEFVQSMLALIELAENIFSCSRICLCIRPEASEASSLLKSLAYMGFFPFQPIQLPKSSLYLCYEIE